MRSDQGKLTNDDLLFRVLIIKMLALTIEDSQLDPTRHSNYRTSPRQMRLYEEEMEIKRDAERFLASEGVEVYLEIGGLAPFISAASIRRLARGPKLHQYGDRLTELLNKEAGLSKNTP